MNEIWKYAKWPSKLTKYVPSYALGCLHDKNYARCGPEGPHLAQFLYRKVFLLWDWPRGRINCCLDPSRETLFFKFPSESLNFVWKVVVLRFPTLFLPKVTVLAAITRETTKVCRPGTRPVLVIWEKNENPKKDHSTASFTCLWPKMINNYRLLGEKKKKWPIFRFFNKNGPELSKKYENSKKYKKI